MIKKKGIALKMFIFTSGIITFVVAISFAVLCIVLPDYYYNSKDKWLKENTDILAYNLKAAISEKECNDLLSKFTLANGVDVLKITGDNNDQFVFSTMFFVHGAYKDDISQVSIITKGPDPQDAFFIGENRMMIESAPLTKSISISKYKSKTINIEKEINNGIINRIIVTSTLQPIDEAKNVILSLLPYLLTVNICIALIAAYFFSKRFTRPIVKMSEAAAEMSCMVPGIKSDIRTNDEIGELSENLDLMYGQLCDNITQLKYAMESKADFMRAASHELKTPIAALNGIVEGMIDNVGIYKNKEKYLSESKKLINKMAYLVNEILGASRLDIIDDTLITEQLNMKSVLNTALSGFVLIIEEKNLHVAADDFEFVYNTDETVMLTILSNIISNAVNYTEKGGKIGIMFGNGILSIENECENIPENDLQKLIEPFYTMNYSRDRSKSGTGLGLYIVHKNLERLAIPYKLENTPKGIKFSMFFCD